MKFAPVFFRELIYGALALPITSEYAWFSMITTTVWSGLGMGVAVSSSGSALDRVATRFAVADRIARRPTRSRNPVRAARVPIELMFSRRDPTLPLLPGSRLP